MLLAAKTITLSIIILLKKAHRFATNFYLKMEGQLLNCLLNTSPQANFTISLCDILLLLTCWCITSFNCFFLADDVTITCIIDATMTYLDLMTCGLFNIG